MQTMRAVKWYTVRSDEKNKIKANRNKTAAVIFSHSGHYVLLDWVCVCLFVCMVNNLNWPNGTVLKVRLLHILYMWRQFDSIMYQQEYKKRRRIGKLAGKFSFQQATFIRPRINTSLILSHVPFFINKIETFSDICLHLSHSLCLFHFVWICVP